MGEEPVVDDRETCKHLAVCVGEPPGDVQFEPVGELGRSSRIDSSACLR